MQQSIVRVDTNKEAYALVPDIATFCNVKERSVQNLIRKNIPLFNRISENVSTKLDALTERNSLNKPEIKIRKLDLPIFEDGSGIIDWANVKLYQVHTELLLMLMRNTKQVKEYKADLIVDLFVTKVKLLVLESQVENERLLEENKRVETAKIALKKQVKTLENTVTTIKSNQFREKDGYKSVSKLRYDLKLQDTYTVDELFELLEEVGEIRTDLITTKKRVPIGLNSKTDSSGNSRFTENFLLAVINGTNDE